MDLTDFSNGKIWAITEANLNMMIDRLPEVFGRQQEAAQFVTDPQKRDDFRLKDGVAIIPVRGPLTKRGSFYSVLYGASPMDQLSEVFLDAVSQRDVEAVVLDFDSPGGTVAGTEAFSDLIYAHRDAKPIVAFAGGMMTSAAYWIGSAAHKIVTEKTADIGSIGVLMIHYDFSKEDERLGWKRTVLKSGKYKAIGNDAEPLSDLAKKTFKAELDYVHGLFIDTALRRNRKIDPANAGDVTEAKIFIGRQAVDAGLADKVGNLDTAISEALRMVKPKNTFYFKAGAWAPGRNVIMGENNEKTIETVKDLEAAVPNLVKQVREDAVKELDTEGKVSEAVSAERDRIVGIACLMMGDKGEQFKAVVEQGLSLDQFKAVQGVMGAPAPPPDPAAEAEATAQAEMLKAIHDAGADNPGAGGGHQPGGGEDFMALVDAYQAENKCSRAKALLAVAAAKPDLHKKYLEGFKPQGSA